MKQCIVYLILDLDYDASTIYHHVPQHATFSSPYWCEAVQVAGRSLECGHGTSYSLIVVGSSWMGKIMGSMNPDETILT